MPFPHDDCGIDMYIRRVSVGMMTLIKIKDGSTYVLANGPYLSDFIAQDVGGLNFSAHNLWGWILYLEKKN